jgi:Flp pilus assembly protein TadD
MATRPQLKPSSSSSIETAPVPLSEPLPTTTEGALGYKEAADAARLGMEAFRAGDFEMALRHFGNLASISPENAGAYLYSGLCHIRLGDPSEAEYHLRKAVELQPSDRIAAQELITLLIQSGNLTDAAEYQSRLAQYHRREVEPVLDLARIYRKQGDMDRAIEQNRHAVEMEPTSERAWLELGDTLIQAKQMTEAADVFGKAIEMNGESAEAQTGLGTTMLLANRYQEAVGPLEEAVRLDSESAVARLHLAMTYEKLDRIEDSLREYEAYVRLAEGDPKAEKIKALVEQARSALTRKQGGE